MPRRANPKSNSAFGQVQKQARALLAQLRADIHSTEMELKRLREEESALASLTGQRGGDGQKQPHNGQRGVSSRTDWKALLEQLPKQFKAADVREIPNLRDKRSSEIFAGITRWIESGAVRRKDRGVYERVK